MDLKILKQIAKILNEYLGLQPQIDLTESSKLYFIRKIKEAIDLIA